MVKVKQLKKSLKTYCKKKVNRKKESPSIVINSVTNVFQVTNINHYYLCKSTSSGEFEKVSKDGSTFQSESSSRSGDEFDRLLKGPVYNKSSTSRSPRNKQFIQRQERSSFYHSDVTHEASSSVHLFKDSFLKSNSSELYSTSHIPTPPSYRLKNKKLIKVVTSQKVKNTQTYRGKCKRLKSSPCLKRCLSAASSTPTRPQVVLSQPGWMGLNVSPILPPVLSRTPSPPQSVLMIKDAGSGVPFDISALAAGLGRLGIGSNSTHALSLKEEVEGEMERNNNQVSDEEDCSTTESKTPHRVECRVSDNGVISNVSESDENEVKNKYDKSSMRDNIDRLKSEEDSNSLVEPRCNLYQDVLESPTAMNNVDNSLMKDKRHFQATDLINSTVNLQRGVTECTKESNNSVNQLKNNIDWLEGEEDFSIIKPRLSLRPGKQWKRSFLQQRLDENRKSSFSSSITNQRRSTIGPALLAKLIRTTSHNTSAPSLTQAVNESLDESLPILRLNPACLDTITKRKRHKTFQPLDIVEEEEYLEHTFSFDQSYGNANEDHCRQSIHLFEDEDDFFNGDRLLCSGVENLPSVSVDQSSHLLSQDGINLGLSTKNVDECLKENIRLGALARCGQDYPFPFSDIFPDIILENCKKIGEGVFGEVFMLRRSSHETSVLKVIPVEGTQLVNNEPQKSLDEVLSEIIISEELSLLRNNPDNCTSGFCELKDKFCLQGVYPVKLVELWKQFAEEDESENDCPEMFGSDQLYIVLELDHAGQPIETFKFDTAKQALSVFLQTVFTLGTAELSLEFEHRDLHIGNVLIKDTSEDYVSFIHNGYSFQLPAYGIKATIIDFTLSRISFEDDVLFCDLEKDPELFTADGDYQFEIYRLMRDDLKNNWRTFAPITNIRWLDYLADKLITKKKYRRNRSTVHKECMKTLVRLRDIILDFNSSSDLSEFLLESYKEIADIIRIC